MRILDYILYTVLPDGLFAVMLSLPAAFVCVVVADWLLELWRVRK